MDRHVHLQPSQRHGRHLLFRHRHGVGKRGKGDQSVKAVFYSQRRVGQHIRHVGIAQQVHVSAHGKTVKRPLHRGTQIDKHFSVNQALAGARCIQQGIIFGQQIEIGCRTFHIPEIYLTVNRKRILAGGINGKLIEYQLVVFYLYRTVVKPVTRSCLTCVDRHAVQSNITMHLRLVQRTANIKPPINISGKSHHLVRDECIDHLQWEMFETSGHFQGILPVLLLQDTVGSHHFFIIICEIGIQIVCILVAR